MKKITDWIWKNRVRFVWGSLLVLLEMIAFVWPVGWGYYYKKKLVVLGLVTWCAIMVRIPEKLKAIAGAVLAAVAPWVLTFWLEKMSDKITSVPYEVVLYNIGVAYLIEVILLLLTMSFRAGITATVSLLTLFYTVNHFVFLFRGKAFTPNDLLAWKTAAGVMGNYDFTPNNIMVVAWSYFVLFVVLAWKTGKRAGVGGGERKYWGKVPVTLAVRLVCMAGGILLAIGGYRLLVQEEFWEKRGVIVDNGFSGLFYSDGFLVSSCIELSRDDVKVPEGYTEEGAAEILRGYAGENSEEDLPHIIMVMNESFADLRVWGDLRLNEECMPFFNSLEENTVRGYVNASVLGGGTANTEFEVLTGASMGLLPPYYYPYQQCIKEGTRSMVSVLEREGYKTYSMHPESRDNWNREKVYEYMGFDYSLWREDFPDSEVIHAGVSDRATYDKIIEIFENRKSDEKLFIYDVTMQNHAGYTHLELEKNIYAPDLNFRDLDMYLNLVKISDDAFRDLIGYFEKCEEKVIVCMFGDHQPAFDSTLTYDVVCADTEGLDAADVLMNQYKTPFVIWTNYDTASEEDLDISMNYLGAMVLEQAGIRSEPLFNYLNTLRRQWPIITVNGICDSVGNYIPWREEEGRLDGYRQVQYYTLFGNLEQK